MKFDAEDLQLFLTLIYSEKGYLTNSAIAKEMYDIKDRHDLIKFTSKIDYRIKRWAKSGFICLVESNGAKKYAPNMKNIFLEKTILKVGKKKVVNARCLVFEFLDNSFVVHFLKKTS
jgi:hypothetical protein